MKTGFYIMQKGNHVQKRGKVVRKGRRENLEIGMQLG